MAYGLNRRMRRARAKAKPFRIKAVPAPTTTPSGIVPITFDEARLGKAIAEEMRSRLWLPGQRL